MNNQWKKLVVVFITVLTFGSALFPVSSFAQGQTPAETPQQDEFEQTGSGYQSSDSNLPACSILPGSTGTYEGCFVRLFYYALLYPSAWIAGIAGQIFDYFIAYTLNSDSYSSGGFVEQGWRVVRDIANASFIFILLYTAIIFIVKQDSPSMTRTLTRVILIAIVINFSLFMTRAIIDAGNILGRVFYEKTIISNDDLGDQNKYKTISAGLIEKVAPQKLLTADVFDKKYTTISAGDNSVSNTFGDGETTTAGNGFLFLIILIASAVNIAIAWIFVSVSIFLVARTLGLWIMMIMSPVAFATVSIPFVNIKGWGFSEWLKKTVSLSFMVVVFMFFLYLTVMFMEIGLKTAFNINSNGGQLSTIQWIMSVVVPLMAIIFLLNIAKSQAKNMAGEFGDLVGKALKVGTIMALGGAGLAMGGAAILGRQTAGRLGNFAANKAGTKTWAGRNAKRAGKYLSTASFDTRNMKIPKPIGNALQSGLSYATDGYVKPGDINFGKGTDKGGYMTRRQAFVDRKMKDAEALAPDKDTKVGGSYTHKDENGVETVRRANMSESEAKLALDRKKYQVINDPANGYEEKKEELERLEKKLEEQEKAYKELLERKKAGDPAVSQYMIDTTRDYVDLAKNGGIDPHTGQTVVGVKNQKDIIKAVEAQWKNEENALKSVQKELGEKLAEHYRSYSKAVNSFDPRYRAKDASGAVEKKAYDQDKKNEQKEKQEKKST